MPMSGNNSYLIDLKEINSIKRDIIVNKVKNKNKDKFDKIIEQMRVSENQNLKVNIGLGNKNLHNIGIV